MQPEQSSEDDPADNSRRVVQFQKSPIMSTYLVAVVVGEYDHVEKTLDTGVLVRVFTPKGLSDQGIFALDVATRALSYYCDYFKVPYPLPKLDLITVPDFSAGAMENWGLITYRESLLLSDPVHSSTQNKQRVTVIISHELAHQWFGNLVTMQWWSHLWLNEGYANFSQTLCANSLFPEYQIWTQFQSHSYIPALELDSLDNTHPVEVDVYSPDAIDEIFDEISYDKGASIIRMLHRYLGEEDFRKGMTLYLNRHQYKNTCTEDLWKALEETSGKPVEKVMSAWTRQSGFPVVSVDAQDKDDTTVLTMSQVRFYLDGKKDTTGSRWVVPIDVVCSMDDTVRSALLDGETTTLVLPKLSDDGWVKINSGACGFYRTRYSQSLLKRLVPLVSSTTLSPLDRINVVDDLLAMVKAGYSSTTQLLQLLKGYNSEEDYSVFMSLRNCLLTLTGLMSHDEDLKGLLSPLIQEIFSKIYNKLGWEIIEGEDYLDRLLRPLVLVSLGESGYGPVVEKARSYLADQVSGSKQIPADLRACVYKTCMLKGDQTTLETLIKLYKSASGQEERDRISRSMGATSQVDLLKIVMEFTMKEIRPQDIPFVLYYASCNSTEGGIFAWNFFKENYDTFSKMYADSDLMIHLVKFASGNFASNEAADDIEAFFSSKPSSTGSRVIQKNLENIRQSAAWLARDRDAIKEYLSPN